MKKINGLAKSFTFLITVIFLASCLLVGCKDPEPEPTPEPTPEPESTVQYMVTYMIEDAVSANENFEAPALPKNGKVDKGTVVNPSAPAEVIGWSFDGWYVDDVKVPTNGITITKDTTFVAKFTENVAPEFPADPDPEDPSDSVEPENPSDSVEPGNPSEEEQVPTYTITNVKSDWVDDNDVVIYAYLPSTDDETQKDYLFYGSYDNETVTFSTDVEFSTAILITVPQGTSIDGLLPKWDDEKDNIWNYKIKQSGDLDFNGVTTVALPDYFSVVFYVKIPSWSPAISSVKIALDGNGYNWSEFPMEDCGNSWYKYEATDILDKNSSTTYQLRLVQNGQTKYQCDSSGNNPTIQNSYGFVVIDLTSSMEWKNGNFYSESITTSEDEPNLN